jgi:hypothetical protein
MPKQKAPKGAAAADSSTITDPRFANFATDPRFRLPSKKHTRTKIDSRFSRMLKDEDFSNAAKVDRYGRKLSGEGKKKALERLYVPDKEEEEEEEDEDENKDEERRRKTTTTTQVSQQSFIHSFIQSPIVLLSLSCPILSILHLSL